jgi:tRNA pseudouridine55 synthase
MNKCGFLLIDKPAGITSFQVVSQLRKITAIKKIGHTGTLDPFATGLLPICLGSVTRLADYISSVHKTYEAQIKFGVRTDTGDITGKITESRICKEFTTERLNFAIGEIKKITTQSPPPYSAVKLNGKRAYQLARAGKEVITKARPVKILEFIVIEYKDEILTYRTTVTKGTYIRTLSETFAEFLDCVATTIALRRLEIENISVNTAIKLEDINTGNWQQFLHSPKDILSLPQLRLCSEDSEHFVHGRMIPVKELDAEEFLVLDDASDLALGIAKIISGNLLKPEIVLNCRN